MSERAANNNRSAWIIAGAIITAAIILLGGWYLIGASDRACESWQDRVVSLAQREYFMFGPGLGENLAASDLENDRPENCPIPSANLEAPDPPDPFGD